MGCGPMCFGLKSLTLEGPPTVFSKKRLSRRAWPVCLMGLWGICESTSMFARFWGHDSSPKIQPLRTVVFTPTKIPLSDRAVFLYLHLYLLSPLALHPKGPMVQEQLKGLQSWAAPAFSCPDVAGERPPARAGSSWASPSAPSRQTWSPRVLPPSVGELSAAGGRRCAAVWRS